MKSLVELEQAYVVLTTREKVLMWISSLLLSGFLVMSITERFLGTMDETRTLLESRQSELELLEDEHQIYVMKELSSDPEIKAIEIAQLKVDLQTIQDELGQSSQELIPAREAYFMLQTLLENSDGLKLLELNSLAPVPLRGKQQKPDEPSSEKQASLLYEHGLALSLEGDFFSVVEFVEAVEAMQQKLFWKTMDYQVVQYPKARLLIELYSVSPNQEFITIEQ